MNQNQERIDIVQVEKNLMVLREIEEVMVKLGIPIADIYEQYAPKKKGGKGCGK